MPAPPPSTIGVLASGGLDSAILVAHLLDQGERVQPFYVDSGLFWQPTELAALRRFLAAIANPDLAEIVAVATAAGRPLFRPLEPDRPANAGIENA